MHLFNTPMQLQKCIVNVKGSSLLLSLLPSNLIGDINPPGLPLKLSVNGTSTVGLKSSTKLDVANFFNDGKLSVEAHVFPSATVQVRKHANVR